MSETAKGTNIVMVNKCRVCTDPGKSWNFKFKFSRPGKSWKINKMVAAFLTRVLSVEKC